METRIVGTQYHPGGQTRLNVLRRGDLVVLERQPENPFDSNAVAVRHGGIMLGYLPRQSAVYVARSLDAGATLRVTLTRDSGPDVLIEEVRPLRVEQSADAEWDARIKGFLGDGMVSVDPNTGEVYCGDDEPETPLEEGDEIPF
jgi:hypothetical protein